MYSTSITKREREVLRLIAYERTTYEIAAELYISPHTAISHRKYLMEKLGARNTAGLVRRAYELGILTLIPTTCVDALTQNLRS